MKTETRDALLLQWKASKEALEQAKQVEIELRKAIVEEVFDSSKDEGTETFELGNGYKLKAVKKLNHSLDNKEGKTEKVLDKLPDWLADRLVSWKPTLSVREYRDLEPKHKKLIDSVITTRPGAPTLTLVEPK